MSAQTVLITGCSTGFGKLAAKMFQEKGWNVVATMRSPEKETELKDSDTMRVVRLDVTDPNSVSEAVNLSLNTFGRIDVLVNNAGYGCRALFEQMPEERIRAMYDVNVFGLMNASRAVLPHMRKAGSGRIINITSMAGLIGLPGNAVYSSSKYAVEGLTEGMDLENRELGVRVKTIAPGAFATTAFMDNVEDFINDGDAQLVSHSQKLRDHFASLAHGGAAQDPQMVADKIYECATEDTPVHNPVGADAEMLNGLIDSSAHREAFVDAMAGRLLPAD